jgi:uncharacterized membrane protein YkgB
MNKVILAGILGGIAMFIWTAIAHMALPLGEAGVSELSSEIPLLDAMNSSLKERGSGLFIFPGAHVSPKATKKEKEEAMKQMTERYASGPSGLLVYHPNRPITFARWLTVEFVTELVQALLVVALLAQTRLVTFGGRVTFVTVAGILAAITTNISYWNWYGFPKRYTAGYMFIEIVGFLVVGLVAAFILRKQTSPAMA